MPGLVFISHSDPRGLSKLLFLRRFPLTSVLVLQHKPASSASNVKFISILYEGYVISQVYVTCNIYLDFSPYLAIIANMNYNFSTYIRNGKYKLREIIQHIHIAVTEKHIKLHVSNFDNT
jgi:hypothetical protein